MLSIDDFDKVDMRVGTIIGIKNSSAQITDLYSMEELVGKQVIVVTNFKPIRIADVKSEVRILGADTKEGCVLLSPERKVENGSKIF